MYSASYNGLAVADFNGDSRLDVFTAGTPYWTGLDTPDWAFGNVLLGRGDGTFALEYLDSTAVRFEFPGRYSSTNASLAFTFDADPARWRATGTIHGDSLIVTYNLVMQLSGFEDGVYLSVNLSARTLESEQFHPSELTSMFERHGIPPDQLVVELTEREAVHDLEGLRRNAAACRRAGIRLAADDVGAGNAGLRLLSEVHFDIVKIDLSLVQGGILHDPSHAVLRALQELASSWNATIVAEGVETAEQLAAIRNLGVKAGQGYLLGRPARDRRVKPVDIDGLLSQHWVEVAGPSAA
jgi:EAL domain-containing protein (putative c-di-GMP-specific phosphodiesterase class I)